MCRCIYQIWDRVTVFGRGIVQLLKILATVYCAYLFTMPFVQKTSSA